MKTLHRLGQINTVRMCHHDYHQSVKIRIQQVLVEYTAILSFKEYTAHGKFDNSMESMIYV